MQVPERRTKLLKKNFKTERDEGGNSSLANAGASRKNREAPRNTFIANSGYISTFLLLISTIVIYDVIVISNEPSTDFQLIKSELESSVHNQAEVVDVILDNLNKMQNGEQTINIVNFIGSTGVGKTFTANIIKKHFPWFYESRGSLKTKSQTEIWGTVKGNGGKYNLVVFDDLTVDDVDDLLLLIKGVPQDVVTLIVCIFNIQETDSFLNYSINYDYVDTIVKKFKKAEIRNSVAKFRKFGESEMYNWIVKQLEIRGVDGQLYSAIADSVLKSHNVQYHGLKGLSSKLNLKL